MSTPTIPLDLSGVPTETLQAWEEQMRDARLAKPIAKGPVSDPAPVKKLSKKKRKAIRKQVEKDLRKQYKKGKKAKAKKAPKHKSKKSLKNKVVKTSKKAGRKSKSLAKRAYRATKNGVKKVGRGVAKVGRKMWSWAVAGGKGTWRGLKWVGRHLAGAVAFTFGAGAKLIGWVIGGITWGWALVAIGGLLILTLIAWAVGSVSRPVITRSKWLSQGRPGSYKTYKAKAEKKRKAKAQARLDELKARREKRFNEAVDKAVKKALKKEQTKVVTEAFVEQVTEETENALLIDQITRREFDDLDMETFAKGVFLKHEELYVDPDHDVKEYSFFRAMSSALTTILEPISDARRGKQLYDLLWKAALEEQPGENATAKRKARDLEFDQIAFQAGVKAVCDKDLAVQNEAAAESDESVSVEA